jgi:hypothetical protein
MLRPLLYTVLGLALLGSAHAAERRGWALFGPTRVEGVPRTLRDNPGAYRPHYRATPRYFGGK